MKIGVLTLNVEDFFLRMMPIKRDVLFFDKILIDEPLLEFILKVGKTMLNIKNIPQIEACLNYNALVLYELQKKGVLAFENFNAVKEENIRKVVEINGYENIRELNEDNIKASDFVVDILEGRKEIHKDYGLADFLNGINEMSNTTTRLFCLSKLANEEFEHVPLIHKLKQYNEPAGFNKQHVFKYILKEIPEPKDDVPLEQIFDFRDDVDTKAKYYKLINWINNISKTKITTSEFEDTYQALYYEYLNQFKIHKVAYNSSTIEVLINGVAEFFEDALTLKFSKISTNFFKMFKADIDMKKSELAIKDRELAYIIRTQEKFANLL